MATKKISLNELRSIVKQIIKEELNESIKSKGEDKYYKKYEIRGIKALKEFLKNLENTGAWLQFTIWDDNGYNYYPDHWVEDVDEEGLIDTDGEKYKWKEIDGVESGTKDYSIDLKTTDFVDTMKRKHKDNENSKKNISFKEIRVEFYPEIIIDKHVTD